MRVSPGSKATMSPVGRRSVSGAGWRATKSQETRGALCVRECAEPPPVVARLVAGTIDHDAHTAIAGILYPIAREDRRLHLAAAFGLDDLDLDAIADEFIAHGVGPAYRQAILPFGAADRVGIADH